MRVAWICPSDWALAFCDSLKDNDANKRERITQFAATGELCTGLLDNLATTEFFARICHKNGAHEVVAGLRFRERAIYQTVFGGHLTYYTNAYLSDQYISGRQTFAQGFP
jgi:hypothetical protein